MSMRQSDGALSPQRLRDALETALGLAYDCGAANRFPARWSYLEAQLEDAMPRVGGGRPFFGDTERIMRALTLAGGPVTPAELAKRIGRSTNRDSVRKTLSRHAVRVGEGRYSAP